MNRAEQGVLVDRALNALGEHFDSVQIFVSLKDTENGECQTAGYTKGQGNWYARYGQVVEWLDIQCERARIHTRQADQGES